MAGVCFTQKASGLNSNLRGVVYVSYDNSRNYGPICKGQVPQKKTTTKNYKPQNAGAGAAEDEIPPVKRQQRSFQQDRNSVIKELMEGKIQFRQVFQEEDIREADDKKA
ncbi:hypothetical protein RUM43_000405 [Polyplax serrata]|uniref:Uncharacterized protein n=1 Tax=Polyplax serrata TaxID=468196 RepID=A0AAN8XN29_POLSC